MTFIDTDHDVIPATVERPATEPVITDVLALDAHLSERQAWALDRVSEAVTDPYKALMGAMHGEATDLRALIAPWVESAREDAARMAEEERAD